MRSQLKNDPWRTIFHLARPYRNQFLVVIVLASLSTSADLVEPLIYRVAVNDVAGLFVQRAHEEGRAELERTANPRTVKPVERDGGRLEGARQSREPHRRGHIAPRTPSQTLSTLLWAVVLLFVINVAGYFLWLLADNLTVALGCRIEKSFLYQVFGHVLRLPLNFFAKRASGALAKRIDQLDQVSPIVNAFAQQIAPDVVRVVGILIIMFTQSWMLTLVALITLPPYLWVARRSASKLERGLSRYYELWEEVSARIQDALAAIKTVKLSGAETREIERLDDVSKTAYDTYIKRTRLANRYLFQEAFLTHLGKALVFGFGGYLALKHALTPGDVVMFVAYLDRLYDPVDSLTSLGVELQQDAASLKRGLRLMQTGVEPEKGDSLKAGPGRVEFKDVRFSYVPEHEVLRGISFVIEPGKKIGIVGPSGAGKTTMMDLLLRLYEPTSGSITIDEQCISYLDPSSVRGEVGVVAADSAVFRGTLAGNIRYKRADATDDQVKTVAIAAGLSNTLERLPNGLATEVGEGGVGLSVGERQRVQLARILLADPRILILDEATANLDYATELQVKHTIEELRRNRTTIIIAHRYSMVSDADWILVLNEGQIAEAGTTQELTSSGGWFAQLAGASDSDKEAD